MFSTYEDDIKRDPDSFIGCMDLADFFLYGWPENGIYLYGYPIWDIPATINGALDVMRKNGVLNALIVVPTNYRLVKAGAKNNEK